MPSPDTATPRKLAAIMFTDIAGYTALSAKDTKESLPPDKWGDRIIEIVSKIAE